jgi:GDP-4-dehydro-6-deoxy-D-mannose reductase
VAGPPLVTGGNGFAGSHLIDQLLETEPHVAAWAGPGAPPPRPDDRVRWDAIDLLDRDAVASALARLRPSAVYHCAGLAHVVTSAQSPLLAMRVNVLGTHYVLDGLRRAGHACPVLVTGSALVYRPATSAHAEESEIGPATPYAISKLAQEMLAARAPWCPVLIARAFNHAGPRQSDAFVTSSFARQIAEIEAGVREPVIRVGNLDARRDLTDVRDTVRAYRLMVQRATPGQPYNVCTGRADRIGDLLDSLIVMSAASIRIEVDASRLRASEVPVLLGDPSRLERDTGWRAEIPMDRTLADLLEYWRGVTAQTLSR